MKKCPHCKAEKPRSEFYLTKAGYSSPYCKPCSTIRMREWRARAGSREKCRAYDASYVDRNREKKSAYMKRYYVENRERILENVYRRRAAMDGLPNEEVDRYVIYARDGGICHICGKKAQKDKFHLDHLIPVAHGGGYLAVNLRVAHPRCNMSRGAGRIPAQLLLIG